MVFSKYSGKSVWNLKQAVGLDICMHDTVMSHDFDCGHQEHNYSMSLWNAPCNLTPNRNAS